MSNQYPSHEDLSGPLGGELREYPNIPGGYVEEVVKTRGRTFNMGVLAERLQRDPVALDAGAVYVQTVDHSRLVDGKPVRTQYFFNPNGFFDGGTGRGVLNGFTKLSADGRSWGERYGTEDLDDHRHDITIGERWVTPLGEAAGVVDAVVVPYTNGYMSGSGSVGSHPPTVAGLRNIERMAANIGRPDPNFRP